MTYSCSCLTFRGLSHTEENKPCQDSSGIFYGTRYSIIAVADGHGNQIHFRSNAGSRIAIETLFDVFETMFSNDDGWEQLKSHNEGILDLLRKNIVEEWTVRTQNHFKQNLLDPIEKKITGTKGSYTRKYDATDYGTTLLACIISDDFIIGMKIGDGIVLTLNDNNGLVPSLNSDVNSIGNITASLCDDDASDTLCIEYLDLAARPDAIMICTDGFQNAFDEESLFRYSNSIVTLAGIGGYWYSSIAPQVAMCTERGNKDDTSIAVAILNDNNAKEMYKTLFHSDPKKGKDLDVGKLPHRLICSDGTQEEWDILQHWSWTSMLGNSFTGWLKNGIPHEVLGDGFSYIGDFIDYDRSGKGSEFISSSKEYYEGDFLNGKRHGNGVISVNGSTRYDGEFKNGSLDGKGTLYRGEYVYKGTFRKNVRHGLFIREKETVITEFNKPSWIPTGNVTRREYLSSTGSFNTKASIARDYVFVVDGEQLQDPEITEVIVWMDSYHTLPELQSALPPMDESIKKAEYIDSIRQYIEKEIHSQSGKKDNVNRQGKTEIKTLNDIDIRDVIEKTRDNFNRNSNSIITLNMVLDQFQKYLMAERKTNKNLDEVSLISVSDDLSKDAKLTRSQFGLVQKTISDYVSWGDVSVKDLKEMFKENHNRFFVFWKLCQIDNNKCTSKKILSRNKNRW